MKKLTLAVVLAGASLLAGCVVTSVYPFYTDKDLAFDPALLGDWSKGAAERWKFERDGEAAYRLTFTEHGKAAVMQAHLFKLRGQLFLDLFSADAKEDGSPPPIPSHALMRVFQITPTLRMAILDYEWLGQVLEKNPKAIRHHVIKTGEKSQDRRIVLTADTPELQKFVIKHLKTAGAWKDVESGLEFTREPATSGPSATPGK
jgi:hypothetical protein